jgi:hypothetical protein
MGNGRFDYEELIILSMYDAGEPAETRRIIQSILPHIENDREIYVITKRAADKLEGISMEEYQALDLEQYKENEGEVFV